jgi:hypothetical protein
MRSLLRLTAVVASCLLSVWALPGCTGNEDTGGKMDKGAMPSGKMDGAMDKDKMDGAMDKGKMDGAMDKGKMEGPPK